MSSFFLSTNWNFHVSEMLWQRDNKHTHIDTGSFRTRGLWAVWLLGSIQFICELRRIMKRRHITFVYICRCCCRCFWWLAVLLLPNAGKWKLWQARRHQPRQQASKQASKQANIPFYISLIHCWKVVWLAGWMARSLALCLDNTFIVRALHINQLNLNQGWRVQHET